VRAVPVLYGNRWLAAGLLTVFAIVIVGATPVLAAAKVNPPLNAYLGSTTPHQIIAHCTFTGVDGTNHRVTGKGQLTIMFADY